MSIPPGPLLASGRDSDIFEFGPGKVLRRARSGRSLAYEAKVMDYVRRHGFPVPEVYELRADDAELVMERVDGPHLLDAVVSKPWTLRRAAHTLADLHRQLHDITAPAEAPALDGPGAGRAVLHLDLHPLNVIASSRGPVVIDWPNAHAGNWAVDVADAWLVLTAGAIPGSGPKARVLGAFRSRFVNAFLSRFDLDAVRAVLPFAAGRRALDHNMSEDERARMRALVAANSA